MEKQVKYKSLRPLAPDIERVKPVEAHYLAKHETFYARLHHTEALFGCKKREMPPDLRETWRMPKKARVKSPSPTPSAAPPPPPPPPLPPPSSPPPSSPPLSSAPPSSSFEREIQAARLRTQAIRQLQQKPSSIPRRKTLGDTERPQPWSNTDPAIIVKRCLRSRLDRDEKLYKTSALPEKPVGANAAAVEPPTRDTSPAESAMSEIVAGESTTPETSPEPEGPEETAASGTSATEVKSEAPKKVTPEKPTTEVKAEAETATETAPQEALSATAKSTSQDELSATTETAAQQPPSATTKSTSKAPRPVLPKLKGILRKAAPATPVDKGPPSSRKRVRWESDLDEAADDAIDDAIADASAPESASDEPPTKRVRYESDDSGTELESIGAAVIKRYKAASAQSKIEARQAAAELQEWGAPKKRKASEIDWDVVDSVEDSADEGEGKVKGKKRRVDSDEEEFEPTRRSWRG